MAVSQRRESDTNSQSVPQEPEEWRVVDDWPYYEISSLGRVRSYHTSGVTRRTDVPRLLKANFSGSGYLFIVLSENGKHKMRYIHALVATAFHGPRPVANEVNHKDGVKANNRASNLEWVTRSENGKHAIRTGLRKMIEPLRGQDHPRAKLTQQQADSIRRIYQEQKIGKASLAKKFGVTKIVVTNILSGYSYRGGDSRPQPIKARSMFGTGNPSAKLDYAKACEIRLLYAAGGTSHKKIGEIYGVCGSVIADVIHGKTYRECEVSQ